MIPAVLPPASTVVLICDACSVFIPPGAAYVMEPDLAGVAPAGVKHFECSSLVPQSCAWCTAPIDEDAVCGSCAEGD